MKMAKNVASAGVDVHYKFSKVAFVDESGHTVERLRLDHPDREALAAWLEHWPAVPTVMEASFGWGWLSDLMAERGIDVHLSNGGKVDQMRKARGWVKTNDKDGDLLGRLPREVTGWWEVWRALGDGGDFLKDVQRRPVAWSGPPRELLGRQAPRGPDDTLAVLPHQTNQNFLGVHGMVSVCSSNRAGERTTGVHSPATARPSCGSRDRSA